MKNYKKGLLTIAVLSAMTLMAAEDTTIYVNTFEDTDVDDNQCSLREAVIAASTHKAYNGCPKGRPNNTNTPNVIQLEAGEYHLSSELTPNSPMIIKGKAPADWSSKDLVTNDFPARKPIETKIVGKQSTRLINTTLNDKPAITLQDLIFKDGKTNGQGGALFLGGETVLNNVWITNSTAAKGGAIFLDGPNSSLTINGGQFERNNALSGSVLDMSCNAALAYTQRKITLSGSTYIDNGDGTNDSVLNFCGQPALSLFSNTITENKANSNNGSIIKFYADILGNQPSLSSSSTLTLTSNTIVKNTAQGIFSYDQNGAKLLAYNILGFNTGKSCFYQSGNIAETKTANISINTNALNLFNGNDQCELPQEILARTDTHTLNLNGISFGDVLSPLQQAKDYTSYMAMYFPKDLKTANDFVDMGRNECAKLDQRGFSRVTELQPVVAGVTNDTCDLGSVEVLRFGLKNQVQSNQSILKMIQGYQNEIDVFQQAIDDPKTWQIYIPYYKNRISYFENLKKLTQANQKYRPVYFDPFLNNLPDEMVYDDGSRKILNLDLNNYDVLKPEPLGIGKLDQNKLFSGLYDANLKCEWDANLGRVIMYRTDDRITPEGDAEFCKYTLRSKSTQHEASAYLMARFGNIVPNVEAVSYTIEHGTTQTVTVDLLKNANDNGDGSTAGLLLNKNKSPFYLNTKGEAQAIRFIKVPDNVTVVSERQGACPGADRLEICHGGNITLQLINTLDPFNYKVTYVVYDADGDKSAEGLISLNNTAVADNSVRKSGGGAMGWISLIGLLSLAWARQRKLKN
ncbi:CSLREA domain-containing protein [Acinetobacter sp. 194]|uniref:CSLREA domain-containing protein n=1 Tax=Acinetobacter shaoyimingii TaxID=2715164 RepID=UPI0014082C24|nr:CSLREA domain-containing protein [Acinetobacter shaoyimingii]NHB58475.1 CSLREA domain-containing protein [Acinetobacter shaoyimingii]